PRRRCRRPEGLGCVSHLAPGVNDGGGGPSTTRQDPYRARRSPDPRDFPPKQRAARGPRRGIVTVLTRGAVAMLTSRGRGVGRLSSAGAEEGGGEDAAYQKAVWAFAKDRLVTEQRG